MSNSEDIQTLGETVYWSVAQYCMSFGNTDEARYEQDCFERAFDTKKSAEPVIQAFLANVKSIASTENYGQYFIDLTCQDAAVAQDGIQKFQEMGFTTAAIHGEQLIRIGLNSEEGSYDTSRSLSVENARHGGLRNAAMHRFMDSVIGSDKSAKIKEYLALKTLLKDLSYMDERLGNAIAVTDNGDPVRRDPKPWEAGGAYLRFPGL